EKRTEVLRVWKSGAGRSEQGRPKDPNYWKTSPASSGFA
nr:hypothetical protein [Tanacetum cinerariifolium]